jgi:signal transduction histidine kinase
MELKRRTTLIYGLLLAVWVLVVFWQVQEHVRVKEAAKTELRDSSGVIANFLSAVIRGMRFRGAVLQDNLKRPFNILLNGGRTNDFNNSRELISIVLLNNAGDPVVSVGRPIEQSDIAQLQLSQDGELWGQNTFTVIKPVEGVNVPPEGSTNPTVVLPSSRDFTNSFRDGGGRGFPPPQGGPPPEPRPNNVGASNELSIATNITAAGGNDAPPREGEFRPPPPDGGDPQRDNRPREGGRSRNRRPPWMRGMDEKEYEALIAKRELHGLVLAMSTDTMQAKCLHDLWLRSIIAFFAGVSALGAGLAWGNVSKTYQLQIRLVRVSELNTHLKEMNLAAAGLAHETRNPLNIIRGMAQMLSKQPDAPAEIREKTRTIIDQTDIVTAQLTEFINYSRPREVRRTAISLNSVLNEVVRTLGYDLEEKKVRLETSGEQFSIEADDQLLRQALFNLVLNAIQAVGPNGQIQVVTRRQNNSEGFIEIRDDGPGVLPEHRAEIFKPYFTTQPKGTGLGLAVVQQIVLVHGWEIQCLPNEPKGAVFRISHLKLAV